MSIRTYDNGSDYSISFGEREIHAFRIRWAVSGLNALHSVWAQFDRLNGDLVDLRCNGRGCERFDGPALKALVDDMQCIATEEGRKSRAPKEHCRKPSDWPFDWPASGRFSSLGSHCTCR